MSENPQAMRRVSKTSNLRTSRLSSLRLSVVAVSSSCARQAAEHHFCKNIRGYITATPFGIEVLSRRSGHRFTHRLPFRDQNLDALPNLSQHVAVSLLFSPTG